ncbi:hypothetical protein [Paraburkholderia flagellata]|uniref:hypothetical protein n=1 Tax=Paraburkholderia flagellata TaxID=2883241 RepID=UPI001F3C4D44|nr:hypothetical protein [Paraburkholderia flagellata]
MMKLAICISIIAMFAGGCVDSLHMGEIRVGGKIRRLPGAQPATVPHPGTIAAKYTWNNSTEYWKASEFPDSFKFMCFDKNGIRTSRNKAAWCIPIVEVVTISVDVNGNPVAPKDAASIENTVYGPDHTFLEHTMSTPKPPPEYQYHPPK